MPTGSAISVRLLKAEDTKPLLAFELENRAWFEQWVQARPDGYYSFEALQKINTALIEEAKQDTAYIHVILDAEDNIIGRINLSDIKRGSVSSADLGYRVGKDFGKRGVATQAVREVIKLAAQKYEFDLLTAHCLETNQASAAVLNKAGFKQGSRTEGEIPWMSGKHAILHFERRLIAETGAEIS